MTWPQAALATEEPPAGPATDPGFDQAILEPLIRNYDRVACARSWAGADRAAAEVTAVPGATNTHLGRDRAALRPAGDRRHSPPLGCRPGLLHKFQQLPR